MNPQQLAVQAMISLVPILAAYFAYRQATAANRRTTESTERIAIQSATLEREKVDATAYERARGIYESTLDQLKEELQRVRTELREERDRNSVLQGRVGTLEQAIRDLRNGRDPGKVE